MYHKQVFLIMYMKSLYKTKSLQYHQNLFAVFEKLYVSILETQGADSKKIESERLKLVELEEKIKILL